jgi:hypothetical protein
MIFPAQIPILSSAQRRSLMTLTRTDTTDDVATHQQQLQPLLNNTQRRAPAIRTPNAGTSSSSEEGDSDSDSDSGGGDAVDAGASSSDVSGDEDTSDDMEHLYERLSPSDSSTTDYTISSDICVGASANANDDDDTSNGNDDDDANNANGKDDDDANNANANVNDDDDANNANVNDDNDADDANVDEWSQLLGKCASSQLSRSMIHMSMLIESKFNDIQQRLDRLSGRIAQLEDLPVIRTERLYAIL